MTAPKLTAAQLALVLEGVLHFAGHTAVESTVADYIVGRDVHRRIGTRRWSKADALTDLDFVQVREDGRVELRSRNYTAVVPATKVYEVMS